MLAAIPLAMTAQAARWAWNKLAPGGVLGFDDYFPQGGRNATVAIREFLTEQDGRYEVLRHTDNHQLFIRRTVER